MEHIERHAQVVKKVKRRDEHEKIQVREMDQRSLESGQVDDVIDVEKFGKGLDRLTMGSCFFDHPEVRKGVLMTGECGQNYIRTKPGGVKEPTLSQVDRRQEHGDDEGNDSRPDLSFSMRR